MPIDPSLDALNRAPLDEARGLIFSKEMADKAAIEIVESFYENFFKEMNELTKMLKELTERFHDKLWAEGGVPGMVNFDARLYQLILAPGAAPEAVHLLTNRWPSLTLNTEALNDAAIAYEEAPTEENFDALVEATGNFNEVFSSFQTSVIQLLEKAPDERVPKSPPYTV